MRKTLSGTSTRCSSHCTGDDSPMSPRCSEPDADDESSSFNSDNGSRREQTVDYFLRKVKSGYSIWPLRVNEHLRRYKSGEEIISMPKIVDYGSTRSAEPPQRNASYTLLSPRSVVSLPPFIDDLKTSSGRTLSQTDLHQRQPLLPTISKNDIQNKEYYNKKEDDNPHHNIEMPLPSPVRDEPRYPPEKLKTILAFALSLLSFILTLLSLSLAHDRLPDREQYGPLPDVFLDNVPTYDWALDVSEYIITFSVNLMVLLMFLHKHRFIVFRRLFLILSSLYMYRAITMYVTVLTVSSKTYYCAPQSNHTTPFQVTKRIAHLFSGFGLSINGKHTYCGDYIYSGHTVVLVVSYLFVAEYTPKKLYPLHWMYAVLATVGVIMVQLAHAHYTVDIIIAYFITTRSFWIYHTLANNPCLKQYSSNNYLGRSWWFMLFLYFEGKVNGPIPKQWPDWPFPWPRRFVKKSRES